MTAMAAKVPVYTDPSVLTGPEKKLRHYFKCTTNLDECCWTGDNYRKFVRHMDTKHPPDAQYFCYMCEPPSKETKRMYNAEDLLDHIISAHPFRIFQCNLCFYRAARLTHVEFHHCVHHPENFNAAVEEIHDYEGVASAIIVGNRVVHGPPLNEDLFFLHFRCKRINKNIPTRRYQCLYCNFMDEEQSEVYQHITESHLDHQLCVYDPCDDTSLPLEKEPVNADKPEQLKSTAPIDSVLESEIMNELAQDLVLSDEENVQPQGGSTLPDDTQAFLKDVNSSRVRVSRISTSAAPRTPRKRQVEELDAQCDDDNENVTEEPKAKRGRERYAQQLFEPKAISSGTDKPVKGKSVTCLDCSLDILESKRENHLRDVHKTANSWRCSKCKLCESKEKLLDHIKKEHTYEQVDIISFIVEAGETNPKVIKTVQAQPRPSTSHQAAPKPGTVPKKGQKGHLMSEIADSTYIGPTKNQRTSTVAKTVATSTKVSSNTALPAKKCAQQKTGKKPLPKMLEDEEEKPDFKRFEVIDAFKRISEEMFCIEPSCSKTFKSSEFREAAEHLKGHLLYGLHCRVCNKANKDGFFPHGLNDTELRKSAKKLQKHYSERHTDLESFQLWDDDNYRIGVGDWIGKFYNRQFMFLRSQNKYPPTEIPDIDPEVYVTCPLCEKASKCLKRETRKEIIEPRKFANMKEFKSHYWSHTSYHKRQCKLCLFRFADEAKAIQHARKSHRGVFKETANAFEEYFPETRDILVDKLIENVISEKNLEFDRKLMKFYGVSHVEVTISPAEKALVDDRITKKPKAAVVKTEAGNSLSKDMPPPASTSYIPPQPAVSVRESKNPTAAPVRTTTITPVSEEDEDDDIQEVPVIKEVKEPILLVDILDSDEEELPSTNEAAAQRKIARVAVAASDTKEVGQIDELEAQLAMFEGEDDEED